MISIFGINCLINKKIIIKIILITTYYHLISIKIKLDT